MEVKTSFIDYNRNQAVEMAYYLGFENEKKAHYCPQASFAALMDVFHMEERTLFKSMFGFHGGAGDSGIGMCGALVGGVAAIGYFFGRTREEFDLAIKNRHATELVKKLVDQFMGEFGGITCREVQKKVFGREFDLWKEEDKRIFEEMKAHEEKCSSVVGKGASLAAGIIWDELHNPVRLKRPNI